MPVPTLRDYNKAINALDSLRERHGKLLADMPPEVVEDHVLLASLVDAAACDTPIDADDLRAMRAAIRRWCAREVGG